MSKRLPIPGGDTGNWGVVLNEYLSVEHNPDGTLKADGSLAGKYTKPGSGIPKSDLSAAVQASLNNADAAVAGAAPDASVSTKGVVQLAGDLTGAATSPQVAADVITEAKLAPAVRNSLNGKANASSLATVATTGDYNDLTNRPTIPAVNGTNTGDQTISVVGNNLTISGANGNTVALPASNADWNSLANKPSVIAAGATQADARTAIGAGTSNLALGATSSTAASGDHVHGISGVTGLQVALDAKQPVGSYATATDLTNKIDVSEKGAVNGIATLGAIGLIPTAQLATGTPSGTTFLRGDGVWGTPGGTGGGGTVAWDDVTDKPAVIAAGATQTAARTAIGAGTSNLTLGTTGTTAAAGDHTHAIAGVDSLQTALDAKQSLAAKGQASGYAGLDGNSRVPATQLGSGTASVTTYLRGDGAWATPAAGGSTFTAAVSTATSDTITLTIGTSAQLTKLKSTLTGNVTIAFLGGTASAVFEISLIETDFNGFTVTIGSDVFAYPTYVRYVYIGSTWERVQ